MTEETELCNFLLSVLRNENEIVLKKFTIEYGFYKNKQLLTKADVLFFLEKMGENDHGLYGLYELKQRNSKDKNFAKMQNQFERLSSIKKEDFDDEQIPVPTTDVPIYLNYIFYNSDLSIVEECIDNINFTDENEVLFSPNSDHRNITIKKRSVIEENHSLNTLFSKRSNDSKLWSKIFILFTPNDLAGYSSKNQEDLIIKPGYPKDLILSSLFTFITVRRIRKESRDFTAKEFIESIFYSSEDLFYSDDFIESLKRPIVAFIEKIMKISKSMGYEILNHTFGKPDTFSITWRKRNMAPYYEKIRERLNKDVSQHSLFNYVSKEQESEGGNGDNIAVLDLKEDDLDDLNEVFDDEVFDDEELDDLDDLNEVFDDEVFDDEELDDLDDNEGEGWE